MNSFLMLKLLLGIIAVLGLLAVIGYAFYRLITKTETKNDVNGETKPNASNPKDGLKEPSERALSISAQVETPDNYEYMFDDCPNQTDLIFTASTGMASMSVQECANKCSERSGCGAFYSTGCTTSKTCDGSCMLVSKEFTNIIPKSDIGRGLCTDYEEGDIKFYRKIA